ncbi:unnamed protein product [Echinostoma caproni]|uniref:G protein gamma domain-containing protein n=1 Tax=Echinostoma caproni TaxID=27848 RepID=A0A183BFF4_9TREM|nr:unnamed protein product [Echinostoma caproni]
MSTPECNAPSLSDDEKFTAICQLEQAEEGIRQLELELTTMRIASGSNVTSREVCLVHHEDKDDVKPSLSRLKFAPDITLKPDSMKPFCEAAVQSEM